MLIETQLDCLLFVFFWISPVFRLFQPNFLVDEDIDRAGHLLLVGRSVVVVATDDFLEVFVCECVWVEIDRRLSADPAARGSRVDPLKVNVVIYGRRRRRRRRRLRRHRRWLLPPDCCLPFCFESSLLLLSAPKFEFRFVSFNQTATRCETRYRKAVSSSSFHFRVSLDCIIESSVLGNVKTI